VGKTGNAERTRRRLGLTYHKGKWKNTRTVKNPTEKIQNRDFWLEGELQVDQNLYFRRRDPTAKKYTAKGEIDERNN
jgi:hypothetical protein